MLGAAVAFAASAPSAARIDYPSTGSVFPPEIAAPTFLWHDANARASEWRINVEFARGGALHARSAGPAPTVGEIDPRAVSPTNEPPRLTPEQAAGHTWTPDAKMWAEIKKRSAGSVVKVTSSGVNGLDVVSQGEMTLTTSRDPVGASIFYRDVPLMPSETQKGVIKPLAQSALPLIAWRVRDLAETKSRVVLEGMHTCANCHSFSADGKTLGMDLDGPRNDKSMYAVVDLKPQTSIRNQDVVSWQPAGQIQANETRVGFLSQVSPDGRYVLTTTHRADDAKSSYYVANFRDYRFLQVFYPTRGVLAWYDRAKGTRQTLPGADDSKYVQTDGVWSPDGKTVVFARARAIEPYTGGPLAERANDPRETQIQYDLYRIPFNDGKGGVPEPIEGASANGMSNTFPKISPDGRWVMFVRCRNGQLMRPGSELYIVPLAGGRARRLNANLPVMNSWHSFSPNGRWLVFSSKGRSPYTQMFLTHIDEKGNDSPAILVENSTAANRAVNLPEFVNAPASAIARIDVPATDYYRLYDEAAELTDKNHVEAAVAAWKKAIESAPEEPRPHSQLGNVYEKTGKQAEAIAEYRKTLEMDPTYVGGHNRLGTLLAQAGHLDEALAHFLKEAELYPNNGSAHANAAAALANKGQLEAALQHSRAAVAIEPSLADAQNNLGIVLTMTHDSDGAVRAFSKAVELQPDNNGYRYNLACALAAAQRFAEATVHGEILARVTGNADASILEMLAALYGELGRYQDAVTTANRALQIATREGNTRLMNVLVSELARLRKIQPGDGTAVGGGGM